jgi:hypothetical protein
MNKPSPTLPRLIIFLLTLLLLSGCTSPKSPRILFIGNSYTYFNSGIDRQLRGLAPHIATSVIAVGGYTLRDHLNAGAATQSIRQADWDYVVLQEQSQTPVSDPQKFFEAVRDFDVEVRARGALTILLMTWERPDSINYGVTTANLAAAYQKVGSELDIPVAPAGLAFARSLSERPDLILYSQDGHPTLYGTYLAACVLYGTIFRQSPVGNPYSDRSISPEIRDYLQGIAALQVQDQTGKLKPGMPADVILIR